MTKEVEPNPRINSLSRELLTVGTGAALGAALGGPLGALLGTAVGYYLGKWF